MKRILYFILSITLVLSLSAFLFSCGEEEPEEPEILGPCTEHKDEDENGICDVCKEITVVIPAAPTEVTVEFTVKDHEGEIVPGVTVTFTEKGKNDATPISATGDAAGKFTAKLIPATYKLTCDYNSDEIGYYFLDTTELKVEATTTALDVVLVNNNPNGTEARPFPLSVGDNEVTLPAGEAYYFVVYRAVNLIANIESAGIKVTYRGAEYLPDADNKMSFSFLGTDTNSVENLKIENVTDAEISFSVNVNSKLGTLGNPFVIESLGAEISKSGITSDDIIYFTYTATDTIKLVLTVTSDSTYATMLCNSVQVTTIGEGSNVISMEVNAGDVVVIDLATSIEENATISFILEIEIAEY